jgi:AcrR family transcriptional regulator
MEERSERIVDTVVELAEKGGFEAVRLRDVASHAGVALGTLYRRFNSKEDLLIAAFERETADLERRVQQRPPRGDDASARVAAFFAMATRGLIRRPNLARALLKAHATGDPQVAKRTAAFHARLHEMVIVSLRGPGGGNAPPDETERLLTHALTRVWFSLLLGWASGLHGQAVVIEEMGDCVELMVLGAERRQRLQSA